MKKEILINRLNEISYNLNEFMNNESISSAAASLDKMVREINSIILTIESESITE